MSPRVTRPAREAFARYRHLPVTTRAHIALRWVSCPFPVILAEVPGDGPVLDIGCGHGFWAVVVALDDPRRTVRGVDIDAAKISEARRAAEGLTGLDFGAVSGGWHPCPGDGWAAITVIDVLYLLGAERALALVTACAAALAPGGRLIVKEIDRRPRWKHRLAVAQEVAATRWAKVTEGADVDFVDPDRLEQAMSAAGLSVRRRRVDRGYPHPHLLLVGTRP